MLPKRVFPLLFAAMLFACNQSKTPAMQEEAKPEKMYCYVNELIEKDGNYFLEITPLRLLEGDAAIEEAKKAGDAAMDIDENGDTTYWLPESFYYQEVSSGRATFMVPDLFTGSVYEYSDEEGMHTIEIGRIAPFVEYFELNREGFHLVPFIAYIQDSQIVRLEEQYIP